MPLIQGTHDGRAATVIIAIVDAAKFKEHKQSENLVFQGATPCRALIDTGATSTMIARRVVEKIGLQQVTMIQVAGLGGVTWRPGYLFRVAFYDGAPPTDVLEQSRIRVLRRDIIGGELTDEHTFDVLLGMDVLTTGSLTIDKDGFRFRFGE
jgi:hypothetical protein